MFISYNIYQAPIHHAIANVLLQIPQQYKSIYLDRGTILYKLSTAIVDRV